MGSARHARRDLLRQSGRGNAQQTIPTRRRIRRQSRHLPLRGTTPTPSDLARRMRRAHAVHLTQSARNRGTFPTPSHHPAGGRRHRAQPASRNQLVQNLTHRAGRLRTRLRGPSTTSRRQDWNQANSWTSTKPTKPKKSIATKSTSTTSCSSPATSSKATKTWRPTSAPASHGSPSTNTKTSRPCSIGCSPDGSVTTATSAWSATRHRPSTRSPEPAATTCSTSPPNSGPLTADVRLNNDYRSTPRRSSTTPTACSKSHRNAPTISNSTPKRDQGRRVAQTVYNSDLEEARGVAARIRRLVDEGASPGDCAILTRVNAQQKILCRALDEQHLRYRVKLETADGRTPLADDALRPAWPCWKHLAQAATLKA